MTKKEILTREIENSPEPIIEEVLDFIEFLKMKLSTEKRETLLQSESSLSKDWLLPEEDAAWENL